MLHRRALRGTGMEMARDTLVPCLTRAARTSAGTGCCVLRARRWLLVGGCASATRIEIQTVKVPVPVACREATPDRPSMPAEALA